MLTQHVITVDVGNTSIDFGWCEAAAPYPSVVSTCCIRSAEELSHPDKVSDESGDLERNAPFDRPRLQRWLTEMTASVNTPTPCYIGSVFSQASDRLAWWLTENYPNLTVRQIRSEDFPIKSSVEDVASVGADRLAAAVAANVLRKPHQGAVVIDSGTAVTVDGVDANGQFLGGAIAPGWHMSAESLHRVADQLPLIEPVDTAPPSIGKNTEQAIRSGLYWGAVGTVRELVVQLRRHMDCECQVFVAGRGAEMLASHLSQATVCRSLVLSGIALAGEALQR